MKLSTTLFACAAAEWTQPKYYDFIHIDPAKVWAHFLSKAIFFDRCDSADSRIGELQLVEKLENGQIAHLFKRHQVQVVMGPLLKAPRC